jgi:hypothetical protein
MWYHISLTRHVQANSKKNAFTHENESSDLTRYSQPFQANYHPLESASNKLFKAHHGMVKGGSRIAYLFWRKSCNSDVLDDPP